MPKVIAVHLRLSATLEAQDLVITREQAFCFGLTRRAIDHRLSIGRWQLLLPNVYVATNGHVSRRQALIGALLYAGSDSAIDDVDACRFHGIRAMPDPDARVFVVVPHGSPARSRGYVVVRRTSAPIRVVRTERLRYVEPPAAVIAASRRLSSERSVLALMSDAVQRRVLTYEDLVRANIQGSPHRARLADAALRAIGAGVRSAPEGDFRALAEASTVLPQLHYNALLRLPSGRIISPDALALDAGLVHETNGRKAHRREDLFEDMQERHDAMTEADLIVMHNPPRRLWLEGRQAIAQFERVYLRHAGRGLPPGVTVVRLAA